MGIGMSERERLRAAEKENRKLKSENVELKATIEYLAMMTDVEIPDEEGEAHE